MARDRFFAIGRTITEPSRVKSLRAVVVDRTKMRVECRLRTNGLCDRVAAGNQSCFRSDRTKPIDTCGRLKKSRRTSRVSDRAEFKNTYRRRLRVELAKSAAASSQNSHGNVCSLQQA